ncbi:MAG: allophanate hydrolase [Hydrogenophaga sp.]|nr:allophanate hydrolase [Hydrogenophaga sp.]
MVPTAAASSSPTPDPLAAAWITHLHEPVIRRTDGVLAGLKCAVKDNIDVAGVPTTAACPAFAYTPTDHASVVRRLLDAGACLVGKTNLDQFACGLNGTRSPFGAVPNTFDHTRVSGGSSSGSAVVVATGQVDFALGTDTAGSGRVPAGLNNIVGFKPSKGLLSTHGVLPAAQSVDCVSIFARTVGTAARVFQATKGFDAEDPYSRDLPLRGSMWTQGFRFGVPRELCFFGDSMNAAAFAHSVLLMEALGGVAVPIDYSPLSEVACLLYDSALVAERYAAIRTFFDAHESEVVEPVRGILARAKQYTAADVFDAQTQLRALAQRVAPLWEHIDVLVVPTAPTFPTIDAMLADPVRLNRELGEYTNFVNLLDHAAIAVPSCLRDDGLPFGVTLIAPAGSDWALLDLAQRYHHSTGLTQGATGAPLPPLQALPLPAAEPMVEVAVVGAHLSGMPLNSQLTERSAVLLRKTHTAADYRLFALPGTVPPKPGLLRVAPGQGTAIAVEVWSMPASQFGSFVALIPAPLGIGTLNLTDGTTVQGFICEPWALADARDISHLGGWRAYIAEIKASQALTTP